MFVQFRDHNGNYIYINSDNVDYVKERDDWKRKCDIKMSGGSNGEVIFMHMPTHEVVAILRGEKRWFDFIDMEGNKLENDEIEVVEPDWQEAKEYTAKLLSGDLD